MPWLALAVIPAKYMPWSGIGSDTYYIHIMVGIGSDTYYICAMVGTGSKTYYIRAMVGTGSNTYYIHANVFVPSMFMEQEPQIPSRHDLLKVRVGSISFLILMRASRTIGPQLKMETTCILTY